MDIEPELDLGKNKEYKVNTIKDSVVYVNVIARGQLTGLYYLVSWKDYLENEST